MPRVAKQADAVGNVTGYAQHGWKKLHSSSTGVVYTSTIPSDVKSGMIEANKSQRVLSTGTVVFSLFGKNKNGQPPRK